MQVDRPTEWSRAQRSLHWWTVALVVLAFAIAWLMVSVPLSQLLLKFTLYQLHKTLGITVLAFSLARLRLRWRRGRPEWERDLPAWQRRAARRVHLLLYVLLLVTPLLGYVTAATAPARVPTLFLGLIRVPHILSTDPFWFAILRSAHRWAAILLVLLACLHASAAVHNHFRGTSTLRRMWTGGRAAASGQKLRVILARCGSNRC